MCFTTIRATWTAEVSSAVFKEADAEIQLDLRCAVLRQVQGNLNGSDPRDACQKDEIAHVDASCRLLEDQSLVPFKVTTRRKRVYQLTSMVPSL